MRRRSIEAFSGNRHRPRVEPLEPRLLLTLDVSLVDGNLLVQESGAGQDFLQVGYDVKGSRYTFTDTTQILTTNIPGAGGSGTNSVSVPAGAVTGDLEILTGDGDDTVSILRSFEFVSNQSVSLDLGAGNDVVNWDASAALQSLSVNAEQSFLDVPLLETVGEQVWNTALQLSVSTSILADGLTFFDVDLGQKDLSAQSRSNLEAFGDITNGGSGEVNLEAAGALTLTNGQIVTNAGSIFMTARGGGILIDGSQLISGSGEIDLRGTSYASDGLAIDNSLVETGANGTINLIGIGGRGSHGIVIQGTAESKTRVLTQDRDITLHGTAGAGDGHGILMTEAVMSAKNGTLQLQGHSDRSVVAGTRLVNSDLIINGNGDVLFSGSTSEVAFGSGQDRFSIEFGLIADTGNAADTTGVPNPAGTVDYSYQMGRYEISRDMINKANNAASLGISLHDMTNYGGNGDNRPATGMSWFEAAQFVNWLNESEGYSPAYKFVEGVFQVWDSNDQGFDQSNPFRNLNTKYVLPSIDEWYKAAYYDPASQQYYDFATGSDQAPTGVTSGTDANTAVYGFSQAQGPADIQNAGGLSPYGMMAMSGNVWEWIESAYDQSNSSSQEGRFIRGGAFWTNRDPVASLRSDDGFPYDPNTNVLNSGFRVAKLIQDVNGTVELQGSTVSVNGGELAIEGSLLSVDSKLSSTTGLIQGSGQNAIISVVASEFVSTSGDIFLIGSGSGEDFPGVEVANSTIATAGDGILYLSGVGGGTSPGVLLEVFDDGSTSLATAEGDVIVEGLGGAVVGSGIEVIGATLTSSGVGNLFLAGYVQDAATEGIVIDNGQINAQGGGSIQLDAFAEDTVLGTGSAKLHLNDAELSLASGQLVSSASEIFLDGASTLEMDADLNLQLVLTGGGNLSKQGSGTLTIATDTTNTGTIIVSEGTLGVSANFAGNVTVEGGSLTGAGTISGQVSTTGSGFIQPGTTAGQLGTGNLDLGEESTLVLESGGLTAGTQYDQLVVSGSVTLAGILDLTLINSFDPSIGDTLILIDNDGTDSIVGTFSGLAEGDLFAASGASWQISYLGGTGNDVTLTRLGSVFDVVNLGLSGEGSLAQAITDANLTSGGDWIRILTSGVLPVTENTVLPAITEKVIVDGSRAENYSGVPTFEILGTGAGINSGLRFDATASESELVAVSIVGFGQHGILIDADDVTVTGSWLGITSGGDPLGNQVAGIAITGDGSVVGGLTPGLSNVISGNQTGILIDGGNANSILGNQIGTNSDGELDLGNTEDGITILSGVQNSIGGDSIASRNVISGNDGSGIRIDGSGATGTVIRGNYIGVSTSGESLANASAIAVINSADGTLIGGTGGSDGNVIASSDEQGIFVSDATNTVVQGNWIGTNPSGSDARPNRNGIQLSGNVAGTIIGGADGANVISGNTLSGILVDQATGGVEIIGNLIGTNSTGDEAIPNNDGVTVQAEDVQIGGATSSAGNVISGNTRDGIRFLASDSLQNTGNLVQGNLIGLDASGLTAIGNGESGVYISAANVTVGGSSSLSDGAIAGTGNVIGGNATGVTVAAADALIAGNYIGTDSTGAAAVGNSVGIVIDSAGGNARIGGSSTLTNGSLLGAGNVISGNTSHGLVGSGDDAVVEGNYVGVDVTGVVELPNGGYGLYFNDGERIRIGNVFDGRFETLEGRGNLISGNDQDGVLLNTGVGSSATVIGNYIGTNVLGTDAIPNNYGIRSYADNVQIGGTRVDTSGRLSGSGNLVSGNTYHGIFVSAVGGKVQGNFVGTNVFGEEAIANGRNGVMLFSGSQNLVGTDGDGVNDTLEGNLLSGNVWDGVNLVQATDAVVAGNRMGTNFDGTNSVGNISWGIFVQGGSGHRFGTNDDGTSDQIEGNVLSGNGLHGVRVAPYGGTPASEIEIKGNLIGTDTLGTAALPNERGGIAIGNLVTKVTVGGATASARNVISGNDRYGLAITGVDSGQHLIQGNYVGVDATGAAIMPNSWGGVEIYQSSNNIIGGPGEAYRNVVSGNLGYGIRISGYGANDNKVQGNFIGTSADGAEDLGNTASGILVSTFPLRTIIGTEADGSDDALEGNLISGNGGHGIHTARSLSVGLSSLDSILAGELPAITATSTISTADLTDTFHEGASGSWTDDNPIPGGGGDFYFVRSLGELEVTTAGDFSFAMAGDDGGRLLINGEEVVSDDTYHPFEARYGSVTLTAGIHTFEWATQEASGAAGFELSVALGADKTSEVTEANGWKLLGDSSPHPEIALKGDLSVTVYYPGTLDAGTLILGNQIGTDVAGLKAIGNDDRGIFSQDSVLTIGGASVAERNVISGNGTDGVTLMGWVPATTTTSFQGNYVGVGVDGETAIPNAWAGLAIGWNDVQVGGSSSLATGTLTGDGNVISGNGSYGIWSSGSDVWSTTTSQDAVIQGNLIGTDATGSKAVGNGIGIVMAGSGHVVGGGASDYRNIISGNENHGLIFSGVTDGRLSGNYIGTNASGDSELGNGSVGVLIGGGNQIVIGTDSDATTDEAEGNLISGNESDGIQILDATAVTVAGNLIGTDVTGANSISNIGSGIVIEGSTDSLVGTDGDGTSDAFEGNVISGNTAHGIHGDGSSSLTITGNKLGLTISGDGALFNLGYGIRLDASGTVQIGGGGESSGNLIGGEQGGIGVFDGDGEIHISGNVIGLTGDEQSGLSGGTGIYAERTENLIIGTDGDGIDDDSEGNVIAGSLGYGIHLAKEADDADLGSSDSVVIAGNKIGIREDGTGASSVYNTSGGVYSEVTGVRLGTDGDGTSDSSEQNIIAHAYQGGAGITLAGSSAAYTVIAGNLIGITSGDVEVMGVESRGVILQDGANNNRIGTDGSDDNNNASEANQIAAGIRFLNSDDNVVAGNFFNTSADGSTLIASENEHTGLIEILSGASGNVIGTNDDGTNDGLERNVIGHSAAQSLIMISGEGSDGNIVAGNLINLSTAGEILQTTAYGVHVGSGAAGNRIGTDGDGQSDALERNIIGGTSIGILIDGVGTDGTVVAGNYLGVDPTGELVRENTVQIQIQGGAGSTRIGTDGSEDEDNTAERNILAGGRDGIRITSLANDYQTMPDNKVQTDGVVIAGNYIGLTATGAALGHSRWGISATDQVVNLRIGTNADGVADDAERNVVSANGDSGIEIHGWSTVNEYVLAELLNDRIDLTSAESAIAQADLFYATAIDSETTGHWESDYPVPGGGASRYGFQATGTLVVETESIYTFAFSGDDGGWLNLNGARVLSRTGDESFGDTKGRLSLSPGNYELEWAGYAASSASGFELSVAVGDTDSEVSAANGWKVLGDPSPHSQIALQGDLVVTAFYPNPGELSTVVAGNYIGTSVDGDADLGNGLSGVDVVADGVTIGGTTTASRNLIAGNDLNGVVFGDGYLGHSGNVLQGNYIGVAIDGTSALPNGTEAGTSAVVLGADNVQVGGAGSFGGLTAGGNLISGSLGYGIEILDTGDGNIIQGNYIGTNALGTSALSNLDDGVFVQGSSNTIGGTNSGEGNLISGNLQDGIQIDGGNGNAIYGNRIGTNASGTQALANGFNGIIVTGGSAENRIGSGVSGALNLISGHSLNGVFFDQAGTGNRIQGNYVGTTASGATALPNATNSGVESAGIKIYDITDSQVTIGTDGDGTLDAAEGNLVSGNDQSGILILGVSSDSGGHIIAGNSVGVDAGLNAALANLGHGISVKNSNSNRIGSDGNGTSDSLEANQIAGNRNPDAVDESEYASGILILEGVANDGSLTQGNRIAGNAIGTDRPGEKPLPNQGYGVLVVSASATVLGGTSVPNLIRFNELAGVKVSGQTEEGGAADQSTSLLANSFQANEGLPVDLGDAGQNLNSDSDDVLDFPVFTSAAIEDGVMSLEGFAEAGLTFDLYLNAGQVGQEFGDGLTWVAEFTEGSNDDLDTTTGDYGPELRGVTVATETLTRNKFRFDFDLPNGVNNGVQMTGIASRGGISEFSSLILAGELASVVAPEITLENSTDPVLVNELVEMSVDGSFYDPDSKSWTATVDYGDGNGAVPLALSAGRTFNLQNIYDTPGSYTVTVQVVDSSLAAGTAQFDVTVANVAPDVDFSDFDFTTSADEGGSVSLAGSFVDGATAHVVEISWGDSQTSTLNLDAGTLSFSTSHTYTDDSNSAGSTTASDVYSVDITVRDASEATGTDSSEGMFLTEISNVRPTLDSVLFNESVLDSGVSLQLDEGSTLALTGAFTDPGVDDVHTVRIDWGDGTITETDLTSGDREFSGLDALTHVYVDNSDTDYTVTIELWDDDEPASRTEYIRTVTVVDVAPDSVNAVVTPSSISEAGSIGVSGTFVDPGTADAHQVRVTWGDGTPDTIVNLAAGVLSFGGSDLEHTYSDNQTAEADYAITVVVSDLADSTAAGTGSTAIGVQNVAPVVGSLSVTRIDGTTGAISEGQQVTLSGSYTDVSPLDRHVVSISWGDGTSSNAVVDASNRTFTATHRYLDNYDAAEIYATVIDGRYVSGSFVADGGQGTSATVIQEITNVAPTPTIAPVAGSTPTATTLTAEVVDPGLDDIPDLTYQWQIYNGVSYTTYSTEKNFTFDSTNFTQPLIRLIVADDDGGEGQDEVVAVFGSDDPETITIDDTGATIATNGGATTPLSSGLGGWLDRILVLGFGGGDTLDASDLSASYTAILDGGQALDYLLGGAGEDVFYPNDGNDWVSGGSGDDNYVLTPNSTLTVLDVSGANVLDFSRTEFGDDSGVTFDLTSIRNTGNLADFDPSVDTQLVSSANGTNHEVAAFGSFSTLLGSSYSDNLTIGSDASVDGGAGADTINLGSDTKNAVVNGGADDDLLLVSGTNVSALTFSGDDGLDVMRNVGEITGLTFGGGADNDILENTGTVLGTLNFGGDDGLDILTNTGTIGELVFNGGADDDIFVNNGTEATSLNFGGDEDILLSGVGTIGSLTFGGDDGADIFANMGTITNLTFTGGADDDIFLNVGTSTSLNFGGDDDVLLSNTGTVGIIDTLVFSGDDGIDEFRNFGEISTLTFNGGADDDVFTNYAGASLDSLTFGGDDGIDLLQNAGTIAGLTFSGGADDDTLLNTADGVLTSLVFGGDDGSDILTNYGVIAGLNFGGGADDDVLTNVGSISSTLVFGGDDGIDSLLNTGSIAALTFGGGADDDVLTNYSDATISALNFGGDDGIDTLSNYGEISELDFGGGADADVLVNAAGGEIANLFFGGDYESDGLGGFTPISTLADNGADVLGNYGSITELMFRGGADDDTLVNYDTGSLGTLNFGGDDGLDVLRNVGTVTSLSFGGGADADTLINTGTVTGPLVFGGDQQFSIADELEQIGTAADDGVDTLANYGSIAGLTFTGGADNDILLNAATGSVSSLVFSGDSGADVLQNLGTVTQLNFTGGADDDLLVNEGAGISELVFSGDDGADILRNEGASITALTFTGGADDDLLLNTASTVTTLTFSGGADDDVLQNSGDSIATLTFSGDEGLDVLLNTGSSITSLTFAGGADDDTLRSTGTDVESIIFGGDIDAVTGEPLADTNTGNDRLIVSGSGTGGVSSRILFSGDDGIDAFQNDATGFTSIVFNGGADNDVFLNNASEIGGLVFNGGADDDVLENNGASLTSLVFSGDEGADTLYNTGDSVVSLQFTGGADADILLNTGDSVSGLVFSGDDGADIFSNTGAELTSLTFTGGADNDIFLNTGANVSGISFSGDDGADLFWNKSTGLNASSLVFSGDAGADILVNDAGGVSDLVFTGGADDDQFQNSGVSLTGLVFNGGADDDTLLNTATGSILSLNFGGDDGNDILQTLGAVTSLTFGGGADDDSLTTQGTVETLVFMGDGELDVDGNLTQISVASDDGVDTLLNEATVTSLTFNGGADDDVFVNNNTVTTLTFGGGADDDTLQNNALVTSLVFTGGADDDTLINNAGSMPSLVFYGDDGSDSLINNGNDLVSLTFEGGADEDILRVHGTGVGDLTFVGGADASADTFHYRGTAAAGSNIVFTAGDGADVFAWRGTADSATFNAGGGDDTSIIQGSGSLSLVNGTGDDTVLFEGDPAASVSVTETWTGVDDSSQDTLDFSSFSGGALTIDLRSTSAQSISSNLSVTLSDSRGIENVVGTAEADTIYGNLQDNNILGAEYSDGYGGTTAADRGVTQWVLLDFDTYTDDGEHVYTADERDQIEARVENLYRGDDTNAPLFDIKVAQTRSEIPVADDQFVTIEFNETPAFGRPGGLASEIDPGNLNLGGNAQVQVNGLLGGTITSADNAEEGGDAGADKGFTIAGISDDPVGVSKPDATSENFVLLSAKIAAHELAHLMGLRHQDSFGPIGLGIHDPPGLDGYNPVFPGPLGAVETFDHLLGSGASVGSDRFNDLRNLFFSERSAMKLALATAHTDDVFTVESTTPHSTSATAQALPLVTVDVPNTLSTGLNADKVFYVQMQSVEGTIEIDPATGQSENDWYTFSGTAGDVMNIEIYSNSLVRYGTGNDDYVDSILRVWYDVDGTLTLVPWFGSDAVNDDVFEPTDSALLDLILPSDGTYYIEVDTFKRDPSSSVFDETDATSPLNPDNPNNYLAYADLLDRFLSTRDDTDIGNYQLLVSRFDRSTAGDGVDTIIGYGGTDTIDAGDGDDYSLAVTVGSNISLNEGDTLTRDISLVDRAATDWSASTVNYGDGTGDIALTIASDGTGSLSHTFAGSGSFTVAVTIRDDIGQVSTETFDVTSSNVAPVVVTFTGDQTPDEGTTQTYSFTASDAGDDTFSVVEITGGDLGTVSNIAINAATGSGSFDVTYNEITTATQSNTLSVKLKDSDNAESNVLTLDVTVQNVGSGPTDLSLSASSIEENSASGTTIGTFTTTDTAIDASYTYTLVGGAGDTDNSLFSISGDQLRSASSFDYETATSRSVRVRTTDGSGNFYEEAFTISVTDIADESAPSSSIAALDADTTTASLSISVSGSDAGTAASGVSSYALFYSVGRTWVQFDTVTPANPNSTFEANPNTLYWFRSIATDAAGNVESKSSSDTFTRVGDVTVPSSEVTSATASDSGLITLAISGAKAGGRPITTFDVYMSVDGAAYEKISSVNSTEVTAGVFAGSADVQGIADGVSHDYAFYTRAIDGNAKVEDAPSSADQTLTATFSGSPLTAQGIDVQKGANSRAYIRNVDILFNSDPTELLDAGRIEVERFSLSASEGSVAAGTGTAVTVTGKTVTGNSLELDFGSNGIGGRFWQGDGFYRIMVDMNNDGSVTGAEDAIFEFYRLFGDANGDGAVNGTDLGLIRGQINRSGNNLDGDVDGSGRVNMRDYMFARRRNGRAIPAWMTDWLDD